MVANCNCGESHSVAIAQHSQNGRLMWSYSLYCLSCRNAIEVDGDGFPPAESRPELEAQGIWHLWVTDESSRVPAVRVLRVLLGLSFMEAQHCIHTIPGSVFQGTQVEVDWVQEHLRQHGIATEIRANTA